MLDLERVDLDRRLRQRRHRLQRSRGAFDVGTELTPKRFRGHGLPGVFHVVTPKRFGHRPVAFRPFFGELERMLGAGQPEAQPPDRVLAAEPAILRGLHLRTPRGELRLGRLRLFARLDKPLLERLRLRACTAVRIAGLAPLFPHDAPAQQLQSRACLSGFLRRGGLAAHDLQPRLDLRPQVLETQQVLGELAQALRSFLPPRLDTANLRGLFQQCTPFRGCADDDRLDVVLVDDRVRIDGEPGRGEDVDQVPPAHPCAVEVVVALTISLDTAFDCDLVIVDRQAAGGVVENDGHLGVRGPRAPLASDIDDLLHLLAAQIARLGGPEDPLDGVHDVGLARAVRADDRRDAAFEADLGRPGEGLEAQQAQRT